jgi:hypothetical protein
MIPGATAISDSTRTAALATGPLFPAYGWLGLTVVVAFAAVIAVMIVRSRRSGRDGPGWTGPPATVLTA